MWLQGLVLDVGAGTLAVYANGRRLGTLVQPGMERVAPLRPPLRWAVQLYSGAEVAIDGPQPPPPARAHCPFTFLCISLLLCISLYFSLLSHNFP